MQQSQETTAEAEAKCDRGLRLKEQRSIIELKFLEGITQIVIARTIRRIETTVNHRRYFLVTRKRALTRSVGIRDRISDSRILHILDARGDISYHSGGELLTRDKLTCAEVSNLYNLFLCSGCHHADLRSLLYGTLADTAENDNALVRIVQGVKDQRLKRSLRIAVRSRNLVNDRLKHILDIETGLCGNARCIVRLKTNHIFNLICDPVWARTRKIDLVDNREDFQIMIKR